MAAEHGRGRARRTDPVFGPDAGRFYTGLAKHNERDWFAAHRAEYDAAVRQPLEHLAAIAEPEYGPARVFRPNRDVRFSGDKSPYRLNGSMWAGDVAGVYLQVDATGLSAGGGLYEPSRDQRERARRSIDAHPTAARELAGVVRALERGGFELAGPGLKTSPRGYPGDHPHVALLRLQHYAALRTMPLDATESDVRSAWRAVRPLIEWVETHVGPAIDRP